MALVCITKEIVFNDDAKRERKKEKSNMPSTFSPSISCTYIHINRVKKEFLGLSYAYTLYVYMYVENKIDLSIFLSKD